MLTAAEGGGPIKGAEGLADDTNAVDKVHHQHRAGGGRNTRLAVVTRVTRVTSCGDSSTPRSRQGRLRVAARGLLTPSSRWLLGGGGVASATSRCRGRCSCSSCCLRTLQWLCCWCCSCCCWTGGALPQMGGRAVDAAEHLHRTCTCRSTLRVGVCRRGWGKGDELGSSHQTYAGGSQCREASLVHSRMGPGRKLWHSPSRSLVSRQTPYRGGG